MEKGFKIYNTLSKKKEAIKPIKKGNLTMFVCGPTVYEFSHIGHARTYVMFDCLVKYLKLLQYKVFYLQNITDVDDKIILRAREKGVLPKDLALAFEKEYLNDMRSIGVDSVDQYARATDHMKEIIDQIERLREKGYAYHLDDGVYFDINKFQNYGKLSGRTALQAEDSVSRMDYSSKKRNRGDFCLWKLRDSENEPSWQSPFGQGRPGWHIEDTAIAEKFFGPQYDIHGGGRDLMFPHHEAEIAQMESVSQKSPMAKYWLHTGFLTIDTQKMSKSLNNFITIENFLKRHTVQQLRFLIIRNLWRSPMDYSESAMLEIRSALEKIGEFLSKIQNIIDKKSPSKGKVFDVKKFKDKFYKNLADDFNTPKAIAVIFDLIKNGNKHLDKGVLMHRDAMKILQFFQEVNEIFGIIDFKKLKQDTVPDEVKELLETRENYRKNQEWEKADEIRKELEKYRYSVEDTKDGPILKKM